MLPLSIKKLNPFKKFKQFKKFNTSKDTLDFSIRKPAWTFVQERFERIEPLEQFEREKVWSGRRGSNP
jgi:hypothetical protein